MIGSEVLNVDSIFANELPECPPVLASNQQTTRNLIVFYDQIVTFGNGTYR